MKELKNPSEMLVEAFREFNGALVTLSAVLDAINESQERLVDNLTEYQRVIDKKIFKS